MEMIIFESLAKQFFEAVWAILNIGLSLTLQMEMIIFESLAKQFFEAVWAILNIGLSLTPKPP